MVRAQRLVSGKMESNKDKTEEVGDEIERGGY